MVQHIETLAETFYGRGFSAESRALRRLGKRLRKSGTTPESLEGVTVYDRNSEETEKSQIVYSNPELKYYFESCVLEVEGIQVALRTKEHEVLRLLIQNADKVVTFPRFGQEIWSLEDDTYDYIYIEGLVKKHIYKIRSLVKDATGKALDSIVSVYGVGYRLVDPGKRKIHDSSSV